MTKASVTPPRKRVWGASGVVGKSAEEVLPVTHTLPQSSTAMALPV